MLTQSTIIEPINKDLFLWRYLTFDKFLDLLETSELYLRRIDKFKDKNEGKHDNLTSNKIEYLFHEFENSSEMRMELNNILENFKTVSFANCWHLNEFENIDMWKEYCGIEEGIVIRTQVINLVESILPHDLGPMHFRPITYEEVNTENADLRFPLELVNYKKSKYSFENEYRMIIIYTKIAEELEKLKEFEEIEITTPENGIKVKVDLNKLIQEVIISPFANKSFKRKIESLCLEKLNLISTDSKLKNK